MTLRRRAITLVHSDFTVCTFSEASKKCYRRFMYIAPSRGQSLLNINVPLNLFQGGLRLLSDVWSENFFFFFFFCVCVWKSFNIFMVSVKTIGLLEYINLYKQNPLEKLSFFTIYLPKLYTGFNIQTCKFVHSEDTANFSTVFTVKFTFLQI